MAHIYMYVETAHIYLHFMYINRLPYTIRKMDIKHQEKSKTFIYKSTIIPLN